MALENYRITEFQEKTQVDNGDYVLIDSATDGTHKYQLSRIPAQASAEVAAAVAAEETAREAADAAEVTARNAAIGAAISDEVTARNAAIAANVDDTLAVSGKAADAKKTGDEIADVKSSLQYVEIANAFDGQMYNGYWNASGVLAQYNGDVCPLNKIDCPENASVVVKGHTNITGITYFISYYDEAGTTRIRRDQGSGVTYTGTSPTGTKYVTFAFEKTGQLTKDDINLVEVYINNAVKKMQNDIDSIKNLAIFGNGAFAPSGASPIADADNAEGNTVYSIPVSNVANVPNGLRGNLITFAYKKNANVNISQIFLQNGKGGFFVRSKWNTTDDYSDWQKLNTNGWYFIVAPGGAGDYNRLTDAIVEAVKHENSFVFVKPGTYNIISEYDEIYGENYIDTHEFTSSDRGIELYNGIHIVFDSGTFVTCNYNGTNETVHKFFSPFNVSGSCEIENLKLTASNCRYAVHDENGGNSTPYHVKWKRCSIVFDNHANPNWASKKVIGGGLGKYGDILIEDCYFDSIGIDSAGIDSGIVTYHTPVAANAKSKVVIRGCYFNTSTFSIRWYGNSTLITECLCSNNSFTVAPWCGRESSRYNNENVVMYAWNNEVRT